MTERKKSSTIYEPSTPYGANMVQCHSIYGEEGASVSYGLRPSKQAYCVWIHLEDTYLGTYIPVDWSAMCHPLGL